MGGAWASVVDITTEALRSLEALPIPVFVCFQAAALVLTLSLFARRLRRGGILRTRRPQVLAALGAPCGAIALGAVLRAPRALLGDYAELFAPGLFMAYGAILGAVAAVALGAGGPAARRSQLDALAPSLGALVAVGRLGCLFAGCCFGRPTDAPWALAYPAGTPVFAHQVATGVIEAGASASVHVHPTALYEVVVGLAMIGVGSRRRPASAGTSPLALVLATYAVGRFLIELLRDDPRSFSGPLSVPQWIGVVVIAVVSGAAARAEAQAPSNFAARLSRKARMPSR